MLTEGYLRGWLKLDNKTPLSLLREEYLLTVLERDLLLAASTTRIGVVGSLVSGSLSKEAMATLTKDLKAHFELALPYTNEKSKMVNGQKTDLQNDAALWKAVIAKRRADITGSQKEEKYVEMAPGQVG